jgi:hypothetical protein
MLPTVDKTGNRGRRDEVPCLSWINNGIGGTWRRVERRRYCYA